MLKQNIQSADPTLTTRFLHSIHVREVKAEILFDWTMTVHHLEGRSSFFSVQGTSRCALRGSQTNRWNTNKRILLLPTSHVPDELPNGSQQELEHFSLNLRQISFKQSFCCES